jgi:hypothetical protein
MLNGLIRSATLMAALLPPLAARAADPAFCQDYTQAAMVQVSAAHAVGTCSPGAQGPRWSPDPSVHMRWCLMQSQSAAIRERANRTSFIRNCRGY